jgi:hypothetical protein
MSKMPHFDAEALLAAVLEQPIGLRVSTNHPAGFRRLLYQASRRKPALRCQVLQCPHSANAFLLVPDRINLNKVNSEEDKDEQLG